MNKKTRGMTLLELTVVLAILAVVTSIAVSSFTAVEDESRYNQTVQQLENVRSSILGPDQITADGSYVTGGYLQDIGWMPIAANDLVVPAPNIVSYRGSERWRMFYGWRGSYLRLPVGTQQLLDGYGTPFYGWASETVTTEPWLIPWTNGPFVIRSKGSEQKADVEAGAGTVVPAADIPENTSPLISDGTWYTNLKLQKFRIINKTGGILNLPATRLKVVIPRWDKTESTFSPPNDPALDYWPTIAAEKDAWEHYSVSISANASLAIDGEIPAQFGSTIGVEQKRIPNGRRMVFLVNDSNGEPLPHRAYKEIIFSPRVALPSEIVLEIRN